VRDCGLSAAGGPMKPWFADFLWALAIVLGAVWLITR